MQTRPERRNAIKVLLFLDVGGSMDPYIKLVEELFSAARAEFKHLEYFYFHNCLYEGVWRDNSRRWDALERDARDDEDATEAFEGVDARIVAYDVSEARETGVPEDVRAWALDRMFEVVEVRLDDAAADEALTRAALPFSSSASQIIQGYFIQDSPRSASDRA